MWRISRHEEARMISIGAHGGARRHPQRPRATQVGGACGVPVDAHKRILVEHAKRIQHRARTTHIAGRRDQIQQIRTKRCSLLE